MKKYKKFITGLILGLICAVLPFVGVAKAKALTVDEITTLNDLKGTTWILNENNLSVNSLGSVRSSSSGEIIGKYVYNNNVEIEFTNLNFYGSTNNPMNSIRFTLANGENIYITDNNNYTGQYGNNPRKLIFYNSENNFTGYTSATLTELKENAVLQQEQEPTTRTIPFRISLITNVFGDELEYINSSIINLPVYDDTVSFTVSFENNKMINGQIEHPVIDDELGELTFSNGEQVFYTIYYNDANIEFKLYFYGEQLFLYEAVMYNTEVLDSGGNYQATVATYSEGISEQEMQTLKNSGIYEASFNITIPQETELVTDAQLMLEIGILEGSEPPGFDNITNIMTGIFTLVSSFLSIQLGFITLGQIIGLILAIGVIFFIFYVWNGGRNGN